MATQCFESNKYFLNGVDLLDYCEPKEAAGNRGNRLETYINLTIDNTPISVPVCPDGVTKFTRAPYSSNKTPLVFPYIGCMPTFRSKLLATIHGSWDWDDFTYSVSLERSDSKVVIKKWKDPNAASSLSTVEETITHVASSFYRGVVPTYFLYEIQAAGGGGSTGYNVAGSNCGGSGGGSGAYGIIIGNWANIKCYLGASGSGSSSPAQPGNDGGDTVLRDDLGAIVAKFTGGRGGSKYTVDGEAGPGGDGGTIEETQPKYIQWTSPGRNGGKGQTGTSGKISSSDNGDGVNETPHPYDSYSYYGRSAVYDGGAGAEGDTRYIMGGGGGGASFFSVGGAGSSGSTTGSSSKSNGGGGGGGSSKDSSGGGSGGCALIRIYGGYSA